jgi:plastocyanin
MEHRVSAVRTVSIMLAILFVLGGLYPRTAGAAEYVIEFPGTSYIPAQLSVAVGDTIIWQGSFFTHPLRSTSVPIGASSWGPINSGTEFKYIVEVQGTYQYECTAHASVGMTGTFTATTTSVPDTDTPRTFRLEQNYPNPFNPSTEIGFSLPVGTNVVLDVYTVHGQKVATLIDGYREAGGYTIRFDAGALPGGVYFYRLRAGDDIRTRRMTYIR